MKKGFFLIALVLLTACGKKEEAKSAVQTPQKLAYVWDATVYSNPSKYKEGMCPLVDQAMLFAKPPIDPPLQAADYWCRVERLPKPMAGDAPQSTPKVPVVVELPDNKVFFGLIDRNDLINAKNACTAISTFLPAIIGTGQDALMLSQVSASGCNSMSHELAKDNPMVVIGANTVMAHGLVDDFAKLVQQQPELAGVGKIVEDLNRKVEDTIRDAVKKPIEWAINNPKEALPLLQPNFAAIGPDGAKALAEKTIAFLSASGAAKDQINQAAGAVGGDAGKVLQAATALIIPTTPAAVADAAQKAANDAKEQAERSADDLRRSDLNPGNWHCCS